MRGRDAERTVRGQTSPFGGEYIARVVLEHYMSVCGVDQMEDHEMECAGMIPNMFRTVLVFGV